MIVVPEANLLDQPMWNIYNLLREACGVSQAEAAEFVHGARLDSVKSWCSDRRSAPQGVVNDLQKLSRQIRAAGTAYADYLRKTNKDNLYIIGLPVDEQDARSCGFPSVGAQMRSIAVAISQLPDNSEIRMVDRVRGSIPAPVLVVENTLPTETDGATLLSMMFADGQFYTQGNISRRKYRRLEDIGWVRGVGTNISDVVYHLTENGKIQLELLQIAVGMENDFPDPAPTGFQSTVNQGLRRNVPQKLRLNSIYNLEDLSFRVEKIEGSIVSVKLSDGTTLDLYAPAILF